MKGDHLLKTKKLNTKKKRSCKPRQWG